MGSERKADLKDIQQSHLFIDGLWEGNRKELGLRFLVSRFQWMRIFPIKQENREVRTSLGKKIVKFNLCVLNNYF